MPLVTVYGPDMKPVMENTDVDYVSFINSDTHGIPALLSGRAGTHEADDGQEIVYVNTRFSPLVRIIK